jgi:transcriptional regulator with XRE-family HTH domain
MGTYPRLRQQRLPEKLRAIRDALGLSQTEMLRRLGAENLIEYNRISEFEPGKREPPLAILLLYARAANVWMDVLVDDELDLPDKLPSRNKSEGIKRGARRARRWIIHSPLSPYTSASALRKPKIERTLLLVGDEVAARG